MGKHKSSGKDKSKDSQLLIRVDKSEREAFVSMCETLDTSAAREIRRFMREFVAAHTGQDPATKSEAIPEGNVAPPEPVAEPVAAPEAGTEPGVEPLKPRKTRSRAAA